MGTAWGWFLILGLVLPGLIFVGSCVVVVRLARHLATMRPAGRPVWHFVAAHVGFSALSVVVPVLGALAMAVVPFYLWQERTRGGREPGDPVPPASAPAEAPTRRAWGVAALFVLTGMLLPWATGLGVKVYLDSVGAPTYPVSSFLDPVGTPVMVVLTLVFWAFPFVALASAAAVPWRVGVSRGSPEFASTLPLWTAFAASVLVAIPVFTSVFWEFDTLMMLAPVGAVLLVPMAVGYWVGHRILVRRRNAGRSHLSPSGRPA